MILKFPEKVFARMYRLEDDYERFLLRKDTIIQFGDSSKPIGIIFMTNPGSFSFKGSEEWGLFQTGKTPYKIFEAQDKPDLTMQNLIKVIREAYQKTGLTPNGVVQILNISNVVEPSKEKVEEKHNRAMKLLEKNMADTKLIIEPVVNDEYEFVKACSQVGFVIMGFADNIFSSEIAKLIAWTNNPAIAGKLVSSIDDKGRFSHPRRWRTEPFLMIKAIERLGNLLNKKMEPQSVFGYTLLRWNGEYGSKAKFVVQDNQKNLQSIFIPGRLQDLVWTSADLANDPELNEWSDFGNEVVMDLDFIAM